MGKFSNVLTFVGGAVVGSIGTWYVLKKHYEDKTEKEIQSVKEAYDRPITHEQVIEIGEALNKGFQDGLTAVGNTLKSNSIIDEVKERGYVPEIPHTPALEKPYVISPDEFGEYHDYQQIELTFYADNVLADDNDILLSHDEVEESCGYECLLHFDEYEEGMVYVRNDQKKCEYVITKDYRKYSDVLPEYENE